MVSKYCLGDVLENYSIQKDGNLRIGNFEVNSVIFTSENIRYDLIDTETQKNYTDIKEKVIIKLN